MWLAFLFTAILIVAPFSVEEDADNLFIFPTAPGPSDNFVADLSWPLASTQKVQWSTNYTGYYIALFQQSISSSAGNQLPTIYSTSIQVLLKPQYSANSSR